MKTNLNYSVKCRIRKDKKRKDNSCPIYFQITLNRKVKKLSVKGEFVKINKWDSTIGRAKGKGLKILNDFLDKREQDIKDFIRVNKTNGINVTLDEIQDFWNGVKKHNDDFYIFFDNYCSRHFSKITESTQVHYVTLRKKLKGFKEHISFTDINLNFMYDFEKYLVKTKSGKYNMLKFLKAVLNDADNMGYLTEKSWKKIKNPYNSKKPVFLTKKEVQVIANVDLSENEILRNVRDMFLFSCYTGIRHSDIIRLTKQNIKDFALNFTQKKTHNYTQTPLNPKALNILKKYIINKKQDEPIFLQYSNTKTNRLLKKIITMSKLKKKFSYHASRHTFISTLFNNKIDLYMISKIVGHKKPLQTFHYSNTNVSMMREQISNVNF